MMQDAADFNFKHVFTIIKKQAEFSDFYHFGTHLTHQSINQVYINNLGLLDNYIHFFHSKITQSKTLQTAYDIVLNPHQVGSHHVTFTTFSLPNREEKKQALLQVMTLANRVCLTSNEIECATLLIEGKTAKEIGTCLGKSYRTIEDRIESLKNKLQAKNKSHLIAILLSKTW